MSTPERLESWKEIAAFLNRGVRTVQRWERTEGLPVHRLMHDRQGAVYAYREELEAWWASRSVMLEPPPPPPTAAAQRPRPAMWLIGATVAIVLPLAAWRLRTEPAPEFVLGAAVPFTSAPGFEQQPSFSPDGRHVVYIGGAFNKKNIDLFVQSVDRGEPQRLTSDAGYETQPAWSPDGQSIAYLRTEASGPGQIIVQPALGGAAKKVGDACNHGQVFPMFAWTASSDSLIVADKPNDQTPAGLFRLDLHTGQRHRLTSCEGNCMADGGLAVAPGGRTLAFVRTQRNGSRDIWTLDLNSSTPPKQITHLNAFLGLPIWLPGGDELAFPLLNDFSWQWQRVHHSGGALRSFDAFASLRPGAVLSPNGRYVIATEYSYDLNIRRVDLTSGEEHDIIASTRVDTNPQISPDGHYIVFPSNRRGSIDLWKADADGSNAVHLFSAAGKSSGTPRWSPDGRQIAFDIADSSSSDVYLIDSGGGQLRRLTDHPARDYVPNWSRDGQWIYFGSDREGDSQIYKVAVRGGSAVKVTQHGGFGAQESAEGDALYVTKNIMKSASAANTPNMVRVRLSDGHEEPLPAVRTDWSRYTVRPDGIFFIASVGDDTHGIRFFDFRSQSVRDVKPLQRRSSMGFSIAPDGRWAVYTSSADSGMDLVLRPLQRYRD